MKVMQPKQNHKQQKDIHLLQNEFFSFFKFISPAFAAVTVRFFFQSTAQLIWKRFIFWCVYISYCRYSSKTGFTFENFCTHSVDVK
ncbi:CLUMA_CG003341, isoform A [Clunio marinus]|uniref:CLUMA_CG003341, isoform A n=1 Tax=Clunio marinus TaxID=568069 RepID=A0A1J1HTM2_9DIPT|nr:CLUMA_CG003341, isoform A [Clunio marinus]